MSFPTSIYFGFDTAENEPCKVGPRSAYRSPRRGLQRPCYSYFNAIRILSELRRDPIQKSATSCAAEVPAGYSESFANALKLAGAERVTSHITRFEQFAAALVERFKS